MNSPLFEADLALEAQALGGESPIWDQERTGLWWVDVRAPALHFWSPLQKLDRSWPMPAPIGFVVLGSKSEVIVGLASGVHLFDPDSGSLEFAFHPDLNDHRLRLNEGQVSAEGTLWFGTMEDQGRQKIGALWSWNADQSSPKKWLDRVGIPNGISFSANGKSMTFADTLQGHLLVRDSDKEKWRILLPRDSLPGQPDGCASDVDGYTWNARVGAGLVARIGSDGSVERIIKVPAPNVTGLGFGGPDNSTLFITSLRVKLTPEQLEDYPLSGSLFSYEAPSRGVGQGRIVLPSTDQLHQKTATRVTS